MVHKRSKFVVIDVTKQLGDVLEKHGFGSDSNNETDITKAGVWDLMDALSGTNNKKFSKDDAQKELERRGL
jgi:hypothetical protein